MNEYKSERTQKTRDDTIPIYKPVKNLQRAAINNTTVDTLPSDVQDVLKSPGKPLDADTRALMEPQFGHDFSGVRVHTDEKAAEAAHSVNALAYTVGQDVVFGAGQYAPGSQDGKKLIAHELTHVVQQESAPAVPGPTVEGLSVSTSGDVPERAAQGIAETIISDQHASPQLIQAGLSTKLTRPSIQRQEEGPTAAPSGQLRPPALLKEQSIESFSISGFGLGKTELTSAHKGVLTMIAEKILTLLAAHPDAYVSIVGHTDTTGSDEVNEKVGQGRADTVMAFLAAKKVPAHMMHTSNKGTSELAVKTGKNIPEGRNRRVEIFIKQQSRSLPSLSLPSLARPRTEPLDLTLHPKYHEETAAERYQRMDRAIKEIEKQPRKPGLSMKEVLDQAVDKLLNPVMEELKVPREYRNKIRDAAHSAVEKGIESLLDTFMDQAKLDEKGKTAIRNIVKGAMLFKSQRGPNP